MQVIPFLHERILNLERIKCERCEFVIFFFFSSRRRHTRFDCDWSSDVCSSDLFEPYDRFRHRTRNPGRTLESLLAEFARLRAANLQQLESWKVTGTELDLPGEHPSLGRVTLRQLLAAWVVHDLGHLAQVARVMAKQYRDVVGPWTPFLPVLTDHPVPRS